MCFDDYGQNPFEFINVLTMMIRAPMIFMCFDDDDQNPYELKGVLTMIIRNPMNVLI